MNAEPLLAQRPAVDKRRRARAVLIAAGIVAFLGLVSGGIASSQLTSSLNDYDAPGSAVVLAQHQIQRATGADPDEGYEVVVRTAAPMESPRPCPPVSQPSLPCSGRAPRSRTSSTTPTPATGP
jgi:hypothetical protein